MPMTNGIVNGTFGAGNGGWTGTDLETNYSETAYLGNGSGNHVAEMDGHSGQITVMQQSVTVTHALTTALTLDTALRTASLGNAGVEGFRVDILNSNGGIIATHSYFPTSAQWTNLSLPVTFPAAGSYVVRLTELGPNDSLGAIIDNVSLLVCFVAGTMIETSRGERPVETLAVGDLIWTQDGGLQRLRWISQRRVSQAQQIADARLRPVLVPKGALGPGAPDRDLRVSQQHRICLGGWWAELHYGAPEVLVAAKALIQQGGIRIEPALADVTYVHFLLDGHQIVRSNGVLSESFFPSPIAMSGVEAEARAEILRLFPELSDLRAAYAQTARPVVRPQDYVMIA